MIMFLFIYLFLLLVANILASEIFIYPGIDAMLLKDAVSIGKNAKISYHSALNGVLDERKRRDLYLEGLEKCDHIWNDQAQRLRTRVEQESKKYEAAEFQKIGLKPFQSQFMTLPIELMKNVVHMACSKHEQQLQCGKVFEGHDIILKRIEELRTIGYHRLMFEHECNDPSYAVRVYPCVGKIIPSIRAACGHSMDQYWNVRETNNARISRIYDSSLQSLIKLKTKDEKNQHTLKLFIFNSGMKKIVELEGDKCGIFIKMRTCVLSTIARQCGQESRHAIDTSITIGYLKTERKERLQLDFDNFQIPAHPNCIGL